MYLDGLQLTGNNNNKSTLGWISFLSAGFLSAQIFLSSQLPVSEVVSKFHVIELAGENIFLQTKRQTEILLLL